MKIEDLRKLRFVDARSGDGFVNAIPKPEDTESMWTVGRTTCVVTKAHEEWAVRVHSDRVEFI